MKPRILILDDEPAICASLTLALENDYDVKAVIDVEEALRLIREQSFQLVLLDLIIGEHDGIEVLRKIKEINNNIAVIMMTAYGSIRTSVNAMKDGAFMYLSKPLDIEELSIHMKQALEFRTLNEKVIYLSNELKTKYEYGDMIGKSPPMQEIYKIIDKVKDADASVMIYGESGTGKELVARAIQFSGKRSEERFIAVNCAAIPEGLLEEEFFGHKKGAFTGAVSDKIGKFELADKGTLFLDEIGDMPLALQGKLLRVLQQKEFSPIGSNTVKKIDVRIISATNKNLQEMVRNGTFRQDLYFRLNIIEIKLPSLVERRQDIPLICRNLLERHNKEYGRNIKGITKQAERILLNYNYPGNIRELENALEYAAVISSGEIIDVNDLPMQIRNGVDNSCSLSIDGHNRQDLDNLTLKDIERIVIKSRLEKNGGRQKITANELGISERGLRNKIQEYGLFINNNK